MARTLGWLICLSALLSLAFCGCAEPQVDECRQRRADLLAVWSTRKQTMGKPVIFCPGERIAL